MSGSRAVLVVWVRHCLSVLVYAGLCIVYCCRALPVTGCTCFYAYNLAWGGLKNGKNGGEPNGFCLVFVVRRIILKICNNSKEKSTFKLYYIPGDFLCYFRHFYSQSISDRFSAHVRPVIHVVFYHACSKRVQYTKTIYTRNIYSIIFSTAISVLDHRILLDVLPI